MNILFLCVGNSARSQIAEGLAKEMFGAKHNIKSAGSMPTGYVHEGALKTMNEIGIDISNQNSKSIDDIEDDFMKNLDYVITLCAEEVCPVLNSNAKLINWANEDPARNNISINQTEIMFRKTRENIYNLLKNFLILNA
jgi:arsenate reductase